MCRKEEKPCTALEEFKLPFEGKLAEENWWVIMAQWIPWSECEAEYADLFSQEMGAPAKTFRMALGALIIKEKLGISVLRNGRTNQRKSLLAVFYRTVRIQ